MGGADANTPQAGLITSPRSSDSGRIVPQRSSLADAEGLEDLALWPVARLGPFA